MRKTHRIRKLALQFLPHIYRTALIAGFASFSLWLMFHTFSYDTKTHMLLLAPKVWSDFGSHIPLIRSFSMGDGFTRMLHGQMPEYPIFPGVPIRYHFLFFAFAGLLEKLGLRIDWALNIPSAFGFFLLMSAVYAIAHRLFRSRAVGVLSVLFLVFNGNMTFLTFFEKFPFGRTTIHDIMRTKDFLSFAPWGKGDISAFWNLNIYTNQRHLALAFALALVFILLCMYLEKLPVRKQLPFVLPVGIGIGLYPFFHQPTLIIFAVCMVLYFLLVPRLRIFLALVGAVSAVLIIPQTLLLVKGDKSLAWYPGYLIHDTLTPARFLVYWFRNIGLHIFLIPVGFFFAPKSAKKFLIPLFFVFIVANLFRFSIEVAGSHKFFNFALILGNMLSAYVVVRTAQIVTNFLSSLPASRRVPEAIVYWFIGTLDYVFIGVLVIVLTLSGVIDFFAVAGDQYGTVQDIQANSAAVWIAAHTPASSTFLNSSYLFHPASMAGRKIFQGWPYFSWSAGYTEDRTKIAKTVYESKDPAVFCPILKSRNIGYVTVEDTKGDTNLPVIDLGYFSSRFIPDFVSSDRTYFIYSRQSLCDTFR